MPGNFPVPTKPLTVFLRLAWIAGLNWRAEEVVLAVEDVLEVFFEVEPQPAAAATQQIAPNTRPIPWCKAPLARTLPSLASAAPAAQSFRSPRQSSLRRTTGLAREGPERGNLTTTFSAS